ncbi:OmpH family outer membrane protein [uncultured Algibacter sp.]|uniref:OmpH family outer membrane protein n=1 Tax=uncultured Algibacter sp. TaxID=298659 RepID=UPI00262977EC|nr:OmpH family outer membrane protein [uncultured Algibacter sp.]
MRNVIYVVLAMLIFASCEKPNKIGFIDNGTVINDYQKKKDVEAKFQAKEEAFRKRADSISLAFQAEAQKGQAEAQRVARSNRKRAEELMAGLQQRQQILQQQMQSEQQNLTKEFQTEIDSVISNVKDFVKDYGKTNGYNYILGTSDAAATVMYGQEQSDLTKTILDALNADYKKE